MKDFPEMSYRYFLFSSTYIIFNDFLVEVDGVLIESPEIVLFWVLNAGLNMSFLMKPADLYATEPVCNG